ncbi:hypothetical protein P9112_003829 [Eukaryota sp. TZLM1-RC]
MHVPHLERFLFVKGFVDALSFKRTLIVLHRSQRVRNATITISAINLVLVTLFLILSWTLNISSLFKMILFRGPFMVTVLGLGLRFQKIINEQAIESVHSLLPRPSRSDFDEEQLNSFFRLSIIITYGIQATILSKIPFGTIIDIFLTSLQTSLYAFEYQLRFQGQSFSQICGIIESNWTYFAGFGLPMALFKLLLPGKLSFFAFPILLPFLILTASTASANQTVTTAPRVRVFFLPSYLGRLGIGKYREVVEKMH